MSSLFIFAWLIFVPFRSAADETEQFEEGGYGRTMFGGQEQLILNTTTRAESTHRVLSGWTLMVDCEGARTNDAAAQIQWTFQDKLLPRHHSHKGRRVSNQGQLKIRSALMEQSGMYRCLLNWTSDTDARENISAAGEISILVVSLEDQLRIGLWHWALSTPFSFVLIVFYVLYRQFNRRLITTETDEHILALGDFYEQQLQANDKALLSDEQNNDEGEADVIEDGPDTKTAVPVPQAAQDARTVLRSLVTQRQPVVIGKGKAKTPQNQTIAMPVPVPLGIAPTALKQRSKLMNVN